MIQHTVLPTCLLILLISQTQILGMDDQTKQKLRSYSLDFSSFGHIISNGVNNIGHLKTLSLRPSPRTWKTGADQGKLSDLRCGLYHFLTQFQQTKKVENLELALEYHIKLLIRVEQDLECCKDKSNREKIIKKIKDDHTKIITQVSQKDPSLNNFIFLCANSKENTIKRQVRALNWAQKLTNANKLPAPHGIEIFFTSPIYDQSNHFIPQDEWPQKRKEILDASYKKLEEFKAKN